MRADFNGDGFGDLAVGVPLEDFAGTDDGGVNVIYGSSVGLTEAGDQFWSQNSLDIPEEVAQSGDRFGSSLAVGDLDGNLVDDLAVGVPLEDFAATDDGGVNIIYGPLGFSERHPQFWSQNSAGVPGGAESNDQFGFSLAVADFGNSVRADLAVGVPGENSAGGVNVIYGPLSFPAVGQFWSQNSAGIQEAAEFGDLFGASLAVADFGKSTHADLAVGVPLEDLAAGNDGGVNVIYGSSTGLTEAGDQFWSQNSAGILGAAEFNDLFGASLAVADFGKSTHADLAVGVPLEDFAATDDGGVNVIYGSSVGLSEVGDQFWSQNSPGIQEAAGSGDVFGTTLARPGSDRRITCPARTATTVELQICQWTRHDGVSGYPTDGL